MANPPKPDDQLADTGKPDDPAKQDNLDTRMDQIRKDDETARQDDNDPALQTTREAGQGSG
ncbi:MAG: hypothetical protein ACM31P_04305 [Actinomycetota bacterium]